MSTLNNTGKRLVQALSHHRNNADARAVMQFKEPKVNVVGAGGAVTAAYEQLRNAAENTEEHLLLQNAIKRFYKQLFLIRDENLIDDSGNELAVELTLAGYLPNNNLTYSQVLEISQLASSHYKAYETLLNRKSINGDQAIKWTLNVLSVEIESVISDHGQDAAFIQASYDYFIETLTERELFGKKNVKNFDTMLYIGIRRALMKSDDAGIRTALLRRYDVDVKSLDKFVSYNKQIDSLLESKEADKITRAISAQGAPLRILRRMMEDRDDVDHLLSKRSVFLDEFEKQVNTESAQVDQRINRAIIRSVIFLIITKFLIGIAVEIPYDLWSRGHIDWLALGINLLFPPIYMVLLKFTHQLPGYNNTQALVNRIDQILYGEQKVLMRSDVRPKKYSPAFQLIYMISGLTVFGLVSWLLFSIGFTLVHVIIFFIFLSAASFLGFRLSRLIREIEIVKSSQNGVTFVRDLLYLPFVVVGQWMSDKYSRVNIVTLVLDMIIELPLKTVLRLVRQWAAFIDDRKDQI